MDFVLRLNNDFGAASGEGTLKNTNISISWKIFKKYDRTNSRK